jgi:hypothetical protein
MEDTEFDLPPEMPARKDDSWIPLPVALSGVYEFAKAAYLLYAFYAVWSVDKAAIQNDLVVFALPVFALIMIVAGLGLLALQPWARHMLLGGGVLAVPWLPMLPLRYKFGPIVDYGAMQPYLPRTLMMTIMVIDVVVYATLVCYPDVAESFGERRGDPYYTGD